MRGLNYMQADNLVTRQIAGETIIVPVGSGAGHVNAIFTLNCLGSIVWDMLSVPTADHKILQSICEKYEVPREQAQTDLTEFLDSLCAVGLLGSSPQSGG